MGQLTANRACTQRHDRCSHRSCLADSTSDVRRAANPQLLLEPCPSCHPTQKSSPASQLPLSHCCPQEATFAPTPRPRRNAKPARRSAAPIAACTNGQPPQAPAQHPTRPPSPPTFTPPAALRLTGLPTSHPARHTATTIAQSNPPDQTGPTSGGYPTAHALYADCTGVVARARGPSISTPRCRTAMPVLPLAVHPAPYLAQVHVRVRLRLLVHRVVRQPSVLRLCHVHIQRRAVAVRGA